MENPNAPRRAALTYTILSLVVRLIASQTAVFSLWFGRRAYERSRGEMITMLYEKTLSRKVVSVGTKTREDEHSKVNGNGVMKKTRRLGWRKVVEFLSRPFRSKKAMNPENPKDLASMGKIMNLMR